jgi:hypothetical protein
MLSNANQDTSDGNVPSSKLDARPIETVFFVFMDLHNREAGVVPVGLFESRYNSVTKTSKIQHSATNASGFPCPLIQIEKF